jgi:hypothetical protein
VEQGKAAMFDKLITATALTLSLALFTAPGQQFTSSSNSPKIQPIQSVFPIAKNLSNSRILHKSPQSYREPCSARSRHKRWNVLEQNSVHELLSSAILVNGGTDCFSGASATSRKTF